MQGVPGSGKSTVAEMIERDSDERSHYPHDGGKHPSSQSVICSTDALWYEWKDGHLVYNWDRNLLGEKHAENQRLAEQAMRDGVGTVIIDNTNITKKDVKPYTDLAFAYGYQVQVVRVTCSVETAVERQKDRPVDRQVPREVIERMAARMEDLV